MGILLRNKFILISNVIVIVLLLFVVDVRNDIEDEYLVLGERAITSMGCIYSKTGKLASVEFGLITGTTSK
ncbi:hypothetical protein KO489_15645, partial [Reinekea forsetii]|nr:hypothetical protein [Reinekea forsetii]